MPSIPPNRHPDDYLFRPPPSLPDPHALPSRQMHIRWNDWEHAQLQRLARHEGVSMQAYVRSRMRKLLLAEAGR